MDGHETSTCQWCQQSFIRPSATGRSPIYCCGAHRQYAHRARLSVRLKERVRDLEYALADAREDRETLTRTVARLESQLAIQRARKVLR